MSDPSQKAEKRTPDWEKVELDYRTGLKTLRQIADENGVSHGAVNKRAKTKGWSRDQMAKASAAGRRAVIADLDAWDAGYVYCIKIDAGAEAFYKVGKAKNPQLRLDSHQTSLPFDAVICIAYFSANARAEEPRDEIIGLAFVSRRNALPGGIGVALAGLALGLGVSLVLVHVVNPQSFHWTMDLVLPWARLLALCVAVVIAGTATAWLAGRAAAGRDAVQAVKEDW